MASRFLQNLIFLFAMSLAPCASAQGILSLDEIIQRHIQALGGQDKIDKLQSIVTHAEYREGNFGGQAYIAKMRPYFRTICDKTQKLGDVCEGYDGSAWEWYADPGVVVRVVGPAAAATRHGGEFMDSLVDYKAKGTKIDLASTEWFAGRPAHKLHVTLADGFEKDVFVDQESFLIVGDRRSAPIHAFGDPVRSENRISDYRPMNGVLFPFLFVEAEISTGVELNRLTIASIEINSKLDAAFFGPPEYSRTPYQQFLEQLYMERTDPVSVMSSYGEYRVANPSVDTRAGVEFIGYQMAKMADYKGAISLLKANATDYPQFASALYALGRAYKAAGDVENARTAFARALQLDPNFKKATDGLNALR